MNYKKQGTIVEVYTRSDKRKSALESCRPTTVYVVDKNKIKKIYEREED